MCFITARYRNANTRVIQTPFVGHGHVTSKFSGQLLVEYSFRPTMPDGTNRTPTFNTLTRERTFRHPTKDGSTYNVLNEFVAPHIESFNALFDDSGLPAGDGDGKGILSLALKDIGDRVVFDGSGNENSESATQGWGNRMRSEFMLII